MRLCRPSGQPLELDSATVCPGCGVVLAGERCNACPVCGWCLHGGSGVPPYIDGGRCAVCGREAAADQAIPTGPDENAAVRVRAFLRQARGV